MKKSLLIISSLLFFSSSYAQFEPFPCPPCAFPPMQKTFQGNFTYEFFQIQKGFPNQNPLDLMNYSEYYMGCQGELQPKWIINNPNFPAVMQGLEVIGKQQTCYKNVPPSSSTQSDVGH